MVVCHRLLPWSIAFLTGAFAYAQHLGTKTTGHALTSKQVGLASAESPLSRTRRKPHTIEPVLRHTHARMHKLIRMRYTKPINHFPTAMCADSADDSQTGRQFGSCENTQGRLIHCTLSGSELDCFMQTGSEST